MWNMEFLHFLDKSTIFCENDDDTNRSHLGLPTSFPSSALEKALGKRLLQVNLVPRAFPFWIQKGKALGTRLASGYIIDF